jgi:hypothetical protein
MALLGGGLLVAGAGATPGWAETNAGPVAWEIVDVTQAVRSDGHGIRWEYFLVLRETKGRAIQFETREYEVLGGPKASSRAAPYRERLLPKSELKMPLVTVLQSPTGLPAARGVTALWRFVGKDDAGQPVSFDVRVPLDRSTGRRLFPPPVAPGPSSLPRVPVTTVDIVVGEWQGHFRSVDGYDLPLRLTIKEGGFEAGEGDPIHRRFRGRVGLKDGLVVWSTSNSEGTLTLHQDGGRRILDGRLVTAAEGRPSLNYDVRVVEATRGPEAVRGAATTPAPASAAPGLAIAIRYPRDQGRLTEQSASVVADVSSERGLATIGVTVNGVRVFEQGVAGAKAMPLNVPITLREGSNIIVVSATEPGGGVRQEVRTVTYQLPAGIRVSYRVHGSAMNMNLKYRSPNGRIEEKKVMLPLDAVWELLFSAREGDSLEVTAQNVGEAGWVTCEIVVEGTSIAARTEEGRAPAVTCKGIVTPQR